MSSSNRNKILGVKNLVEAVNTEIAKVRIGQGRGNVNESLNERSLRFYLTEGLLPPAISKEGVQAVFNHQHVLTAVAVKKLQSVGFSIRQIKKTFKGPHVIPLETFISRPLPDFESADEIEDYASFRNDVNLSTTSSELTKIAETKNVEERSIETPTGWKSVQIEEGLELRASDDWKSPFSLADGNRLIEKIKKAISDLE